MFSGEPSSTDVNMSLQPSHPSNASGLTECKMAQEIIHDLVTKLCDLFKLLNSPEIESKKANIKNVLKFFQCRFKQLRAYHDSVQEISSRSTYIQIKLLVPYKDDPGRVEQILKHRRNISSESKLIERRDELLEKLAEKDEQIRQMTNCMRSFIYEINTMLFR